VTPIGAAGGIVSSPVPPGVGFEVPTTASPVEMALSRR
jgi:hypothetical protein